MATTPSTSRRTERNAALRRAWHPVATSAEIGGQPTQVWLLDEPWAVFRDGPDVRAFVDRCPHRLAPITAGTREADGMLQCAYHGWRFDTSGRCMLIPALSPGAAIPDRARLGSPAAVVERAGLVWIAPDEPCVPLIDVDPPDDAITGMLVPSRAAVDPGEMMDNFLDVTHFPFVHAETFGAEGSDRVDEYRVQRRGLGFSAVTQHRFSHHEDPGVGSGVRPLVQRRRLTYTYAPPFSATLRLDFLDAGGANLILLAVQPEREGQSRVYTVLFRNDVAESEMPAALRFQQRVLDEDLAVQRSLHTTLPTDVTTEVHTKADRVTIELRRSFGRFLDA